MVEPDTMYAAELSCLPHWSTKTQSLDGSPLGNAEEALALCDELARKLIELRRSQPAHTLTCSDDDIVPNDDANTLRRSEVKLLSQREHATASSLCSGVVPTSMTDQPARMFLLSAFDLAANTDDRTVSKADLDEAQVKFVQWTLPEAAKEAIALRRSHGSFDSVWSVRTAISTRLSGRYESCLRDSQCGAEWLDRAGELETSSCPPSPQLYFRQASEVKRASSPNVASAVDRPGPHGPWKHILQVAQAIWAAFPKAEPSSRDEKPNTSAESSRVAAQGNSSQPRERSCHLARKHRIARKVNFYQLQRNWENSHDDDYHLICNPRSKGTAPNETNHAIPRIGD